jgi:hypothetical protein
LLPAGLFAVPSEEKEDDNNKKNKEKKTGRKET